MRPPRPDSTPIKINAVLLRGVNDDQAAGTARLVLSTRGHQLRFIEQMPLDADHSWDRATMVTAAEIRTSLSVGYSLCRRPSLGMARRPSSSTSSRAPAARGRSASSPPSRNRSARTAAAPGSPPRDRSQLPVLARGVRPAWRAALGSSDAHLAVAGRGHVGEAVRHGLDATGFVQPARTMSAIGG